MTASLDREFFKRHTAYIVIAILLLGAGLRAYRLDYQSLWHDEVRTALRSNEDHAHVLARGNLYVLILHALPRVGRQEYMLRLPSMVFGSLSILLLYFVVSNWFGRGIALIGAMIMAISPLHIWYSQETRAYALMLFLSLLSLWSMQQLMKGRTNFWWRLAFIISTSATIYCRPVAIAFISFLWVYVLIVSPRQKWMDWLPLFGAIALAITPKIYPLVVATTGSSEIQPSQQFNPLAIAYGIWVFGTGFSLGPTVAQLHMPGRMGILSDHFEIILPVMLFFSATFLLGALTLGKKDRRLFWVTALWFLFPLAFGILGIFLTSFQLNPRYWILAFPPFIVFITVGALSFRVIWVRATAFAIIGLISVFSLGNYFFNERYHRENIRAAGQFLTAHSQANDLVICNAAYTVEGLQYYYSGNNDLIFVRYPLGYRYVELSRLESELKTILADRDRFWIYLSRIFHSDPKGYLRKYCDAHFRPDLELKRNGVELVLYKALPNNLAQRDEPFKGLSQDAALIKTGTHRRHFSLPRGISAPGR